MYEKNWISTRFIEKILQDSVDQLYYEYFEEGFVIQFKQGKYTDSTECKIFPLKNNKVILGKQWIDKRKASYDEETHILEIF